MTAGNRNMNVFVYTNFNGFSHFQSYRDKTLPTTLKLFNCLIDDLNSLTNNNTFPGLN